MTTQSENNLMKSPDETAALFDQLEAEYQHRMAYLQRQYEGADPRTPEGQAVMAEIETLADEANHSHNALIAIRQQMKDLEFLKNAQSSLILILKAKEKEELDRIRGYQVRLDRLDTGRRKQHEDKANTGEYNRVMTAARNSVHR